MPDECAHARSIRNVMPSRARMRGMSETWFGVGASAPLPDVRPCRLLRQLAKPSHHQAFSQDPQATIRRKGGDGAMSMKLVWTLAAARRRITDHSRGTISSRRGERLRSSSTLVPTEFATARLLSRLRPPTCERLLTTVASQAATTAAKVLPSRGAARARRACVVVLPRAPMFDAERGDLDLAGGS
jgi:hypothetical protein